MKSLPSKAVVDMHKDIANCLLDLNSTAVLVLAAERGLIGGLACAMEECRCPEGRKHFEPKRGWNRWAPSADRYPIPGRDGGQYTPDNVRLSHFQCNRAEGGRAKPSAAARVKMSAAKAGSKDTAEARANKSAAAFRRQPASETSRAKMSAAQTGRIVSAKGRDNMSAARRNRQPDSDVTRARRSSSAFASWARRHLETGNV